jgi:type I restriction enzyme, S subunit
MTNSLGVLYIPQKSTPPKGWKLIRVGDYAKLVAGGTPSTRVDAYWEDGDILWMRSGDVHKKRIFNVDGKITKIGLENSSAALLPKNSVLIALAGQGKTRGTVAINKVDLSTNQSVAAIIPKKELDYEFLYYNLDARYELLRRLSTGDGGRGGLNLQILKNIWCAVPPLPEQRKIADILSTWDEAIAKTEQFIAILQTRKKGLMQRLLTGEFRFAGFDDEWQEFKLGQIASKNRYSFTGGPFGSNLKAESYTTTGVRIIQLQNIGDGEFLDGYKIYTSEEKADELLSCNIYPGDIILSKMGDPVARATIIPNTEERFLMASDGIRLEVDKKRFDTHFVLEAINAFEFRKNAIRHSVGSTRQRISLGDLRNLPIKAPTLAEQQKISSVLRSCNQEIELNSQKVKLLKLQKKGLMQRLLTGQVRVKADRSGK